MQSKVCVCVPILREMFGFRGTRYLTSQSDRSSVCHECESVWKWCRQKMRGAFLVCITHTQALRGSPLRKCAWIFDVSEYWISKCGFRFADRWKSTLFIDKPNNQKDDAALFGGKNKTSIDEEGDKPVPYQCIFSLQQHLCKSIVCIQHLETKQTKLSRRMFPSCLPLRSTASKSTIRSGNISQIQRDFSYHASFTFWNTHCAQPNGKTKNITNCLTCS